MHNEDDFQMLLSQNLHDMCQCYTTSVQDQFISGMHKAKSSLHLHISRSWPWWLQQIGLRRLDMTYKCIVFSFIVGHVGWVIWWYFGMQSEKWAIFTYSCTNVLLNGECTNVHSPSWITLDYKQIQGKGSYTWTLMILQRMVSQPFTYIGFPVINIQMTSLPLCNRLIGGNLRLPSLNIIIPPGLVEFRYVTLKRYQAYRRTMLAV